MKQVMSRAMRRRRQGRGGLAALIGVALFGGPLIAAPTLEDSRPRTGLSLRTETDPADGSRISSGTFRVFEDRVARSGRILELGVVVLHARSETPRPDPMFILTGGPGSDATASRNGYRNHWMRRERDVVLVSQRGTAGNHALRIALPASDANLQGYLEPIFDVAACRAGLEQLSRKADLTLYSTPIAMDDLDDVRQALGYDRINVHGGSYGTRACLVYLRRHPEHARTAILMGVAPIMFKNPLFHAWSAQQGLERLFEEVEGDPEYRRALPHLRERFAAVMRRLDEEPARVTIRHPGTGEPAEVTLTRQAFAEALRTLMYFQAGNRRVPYLLRQAYFGDLAPFAQAGLETSRGIRNMLAFGMLLSVTAAEDVARIQEEEIVRWTRGTFLGDDRVRQQMAVCSFWPRSDLPESYGEPVRSDVPTLLISGSHDPVTPPEMGEEVANQFSNARHLILHGVHGVSHPALSRVLEEFLDEASVDDLELEQLESVRMPRLLLPRPM